MGDSSFDTEDYASISIAHSKKLEAGFSLERPVKSALTPRERIQTAMDAWQDIQDEAEARKLAGEDHSARLKRLVGYIELGMDCKVRLEFDKDRGDWFVQIQCWRRDTITGQMGWGFGGKGWPSPHSSDSEVIQMIFGLYKGYWEHEARETFILRDRRPFGPHIDTWALWSVSRLVDVRSQKHVEDQPKPEATPMSPWQKAKAMRNGEPVFDGYGKPMTKNARGEWVNDRGDTPCPNDGEMTNIQCWQCGWMRGVEHG